MLDKLTTELKLRGFSEQTVRTYLFHNKKFLQFIKKEPDLVDEDDIKKYIAFLMDNEQKPASINLILSALKFFHKEILGNDVFGNIKAPKLEKKIPRLKLEKNFNSPI